MSSQRLLQTQLNEHRYGRRCQTPQRPRGFNTTKYAKLQFFRLRQSVGRRRSGFSARHIVSLSYRRLFGHRLSVCVQLATYGRTLNHTQAPQRVVFTAAAVAADHAPLEMRGLRQIHDYRNRIHRVTHTHTHPFNGPFSGTTRVSRYQKGKTNLDYTEARDSQWQWNLLVHMQVCISLQTDNHTSTPLLSFYRPDA